MKRNVGTLVFCFALIASLLVGCAQPKKSNDNQQTTGNQVDDDTKDNDSQENNQDNKAEIVITPTYIGTKNADIVFTWQPVPAHSMFSTNQARVDFIKGKCKEWAERNPGVGVEIIETTTNMNEAMAKNLIQLASGAEVPDLTAIDSFIFKRFAPYAQPIDDILSERAIDVNDFFPFIQEQIKPEDKTLGIWYTTDVRTLYYRKDLIETPPTTVTEMLEVGKKMKEQGLTGLVYAATRETTLTDVLLPLFWGQGGNLVDEAGKPVFGEGENREYMLNALKFYSDTIQSGVTPERVLSIAETGFSSDVASGTLAMYYAGNWDVKNQRGVMGDQFDEKWDVASLPMVNSGDRQTTAGGWISTVFSKDEQIRKLAADLAITVYGDDVGMEGWCSVGGYLPTRKSIYESASFKDDPFIKTFKDELNYARIRPAAEIYPEVSASLQDMVEELVIGTDNIEGILDQSYQEVLSEYESLK